MRDLSCPFVSTLSFGLSDLLPWIFACLLVMIIARLTLQVKVIGQGKAQCKMCVLTRASLSTAASYEHRLVAVVVGFHSDVISCELARRGEWGGASEVSDSGRSSTTGRGNAVGVTSILIEDSFLVIS